MALCFSTTHSVYFLDFLALRKKNKFIYGEIRNNGQFVTQSLKGTHIKEQIEIQKVIHSPQYNYCLTTQ